MRRPAALVGVLLSAVVAAASVGPAAHADVNKVVITVGFSPGGGNDLYARLLSRHFKKHLPGDASVLVRNLPGSGSLKAVQSLQIESRDEINIVTFNYGLITESQVKSGSYQAQVYGRGMDWKHDGRAAALFCVAHHRRQELGRCDEEGPVCGWGTGDWLVELYLRRHSQERPQRPDPDRNRLFREVRRSASRSNAASWTADAGP